MNGKVLCIHEHKALNTSQYEGDHEFIVTHKMVKKIVLAVALLIFQCATLKNCVDEATCMVYNVHNMLNLNHCVFCQARRQL